MPSRPMAPRSAPHRNRMSRCVDEPSKLTLGGRQSSELGQQVHVEVPLGFEEPKETQLVRISPRYVRLRQGSEIRYRLKLVRPPSKGKGVTIHVCVLMNKCGITASPMQLVVTANDWRRPREIVVSSAVDSELRTLQIHHKIHETYDDVYNANTPLPSLFVSVLQKEATFLFAFGCGTHGRLGTSGETSATLPTPFSCRWLHPVQLACGKAHSAVVDVYSNLYCFGLGEHGQLGQGVDNLDSSRLPIRVPQLSSISVQHVACGSSHTLCLSVDGRVFAWGDNSLGQLGLGSKSEKLVATPARVEKAASVRTIACGGSQSFLLTKECVLACGSNVVGQLGLGDRRDRANFERIAFFRKRRVVSGAPNGHIHGFNNAFGDLEMEEVDPADVHIACGLYHTVALWAGRVYSWGNGDDGRLGHGDLENRLVPTLVQSLKAVVIASVACGGSHSGAVAVDGAVFTWGNGQLGQLGLGTSRSRRVPTRVRLLQGKIVLQLAFGEWHSLALCQDGSLYSWGFGEEGQLGLPDTDLEPTRRVALLPTVVHALSGTGATLVRCGGSHTFVVSVQESRRQQLAKIHHKESLDAIRREGDWLALRERRLSRRFEGISPRRQSTCSVVSIATEPDKTLVSPHPHEQPKSNPPQSVATPTARRYSSARRPTRKESIVAPETASAVAKTFNWKTRPLSSRTSVRNVFRQHNRELDEFRDVLAPPHVLPERPSSILGISPRLQRLDAQLRRQSLIDDPAIAQAVAAAVDVATERYSHPGSHGLHVESKHNASSVVECDEANADLEALTLELQVPPEAWGQPKHGESSREDGDLVLITASTRFGSCQALEADIRSRLSRQQRGKRPHAHYHPRNGPPTR